jgi:hypothetical protein
MITPIANRNISKKGIKTAVRKVICVVGDDMA